MSNITVTNLVISGTLDTRLDLDAVEEDLDGEHKYDPKTFPALMYKAETSSSVSVFSSGKIICTGLKDEQEGMDAIDAFLDELDADIERPPLEIQNYVCTAEIDATLNLNALVIGLGFENAEYEPEQFPGLIYKPEKPRVCYLIYSTGSMVILGATTIEQAEDAYEHLFNELGDCGLLD